MPIDFRSVALASNTTGSSKPSKPSKSSKSLKSRDDLDDSNGFNVFDDFDDYPGRFWLNDKVVLIYPLAQEWHLSISNAMIIHQSHRRLMENGQIVMAPYPEGAIVPWVDVLGAYGEEWQDGLCRSSMKDTLQNKVREYEIE